MLWSLFKAKLTVCCSLALLLLSGVLSATEQPYRHASEPIGSVRQVYDGKLYPDLQVNTFRNIDRLFPTRAVARGDTVSALPLSKTPLTDFSYQVAGEQYDMFDVLSINRVSGMLIIHNGEIAFEHYALGNDAQTRWMSMSVVKSITATLIGAAIQDGAINSIDDPIVLYLPRFKGSAYEGVTVKHLLQMSSGVAWNETYTDPNSDRRRMLEAQLSQQPGAILDLMASLPRAAAPGSVWNYSTGETQLAGALVAAATGKPVAEYLSEKIWSKMGMQAEANWWLQSPDGLEIGGSGLSATLRDYGRFGLFLLNDGVINQQRILPKGWMAQASSRQVIAGETIDYGYMFWPMHGRSYAAEGIFGQYVFVDPDKNLVVAMWSAQSKPLGMAGLDEYTFFKALSAHFDSNSVKD
ncbi:serine hydrolase domain-containing protein [Rheinheimera sp. UJ63]|uniref:serine hydrolase domain-containing protein n=1 Tax=Rheinheimera sp. UJ63 TaxID=2910157 RepID=UPI001F40AA44|nr:serine hydrolase domain-containing protein [Rheinheimera sp. UJ63]MCF4009517.1 beta-lactamase family protein [Rheinheimera sp. UJ63]